MIVRGLIVTTGCALALAACGSSGSGTSASGKASDGTSASAKASDALKLSACMRSHGVSNFPDPSGGRLEINPNSGLDPRSPAFQAAQRSCKQYLPNGGGPPPKPSAADLRTALAWAQCVRKHGVPNFPDPTYSANPSGLTLVFRGVQFQLPSSIEPRSPAFRQAQAACGFGPGGDKLRGQRLSTR